MDYKRTDQRLHSSPTSQAAAKSLLGLGMHRPTYRSRLCEERQGRLRSFAKAWLPGCEIDIQSRERPTSGTAPEKPARRRRRPDRLGLQEDGGCGSGWEHERSAAPVSATVPMQNRRPFLSLGAISSYQPTCMLSYPGQCRLSSSARAQCALLVSATYASFPHVQPHKKCHNEYACQYSPPGPRSFRTDHRVACQVEQNHYANPYYSEGYPSSS